MKIYIAGPMSGYPDLNQEAFNRKAAYLRSTGQEVINPVELNGGADELTAVPKMSNAEYQIHWQSCMKKDIAALMQCDAVQMLPGWEKSRGATIEHDLALKLGLSVFY